MRDGLTAPGVGAIVVWSALVLDTVVKKSDAPC
jgi:hypothetical protein